MATASESKYAAVFIVAAVLFTSYLHYSTIPQILILHDIYREFYYIPVLVSALVYGLRGAIVTFIMIVLLYAPWIVLHWTGDFIVEANRLIQLIFLGTVATLSGFLINRDRKSREQADKEHYLAVIGQVSTNIVHDLKNPLITILGFGRRYLEGKEEPENAIQYIMDSAEKMLKIVHDVLDFSKPLQLDIAETDTREVVSRACASCAAKAENDGVYISQDMPSAPVILQVDSFHLERALVNLISNAVEASERGQSVFVNLSAEKDYAIIKIRDEGSGMTKETQKNMFVPFSTKKEGGTGLGMPIAKKIIDSHGGRIRIYSQPGWGTEAKIFFSLKG